LHQSLAFVSQEIAVVDRVQDVPAAHRSIRQ
jgi:hypothetical protein